MNTVTWQTYCNVIYAGHHCPDFCDRFKFYFGSWLGETVRQRYNIRRAIKLAILSKAIV